MAKRFSRINFIIVSILVAIGIFLSVCSFRMPFGSTDNFAGFINAIPLGYDLGEGRTAVYECTTTSEEITTLSSEKMDETVKFVNNALKMFGYSNTQIGKQNDNMIRVEVVNDSASSTILSAMNERLELIIRGEETTNKTEYDISSQRIKKCSLSYQQSSSDSTKYEYGVLIEFDSLGSKQYRELTKYVKDNGNKVYFYNAETNEKVGTLDSIKKEITSGSTFLANSSATTENALNAYALNVYMGSFDVKLTLKESSVNSPALGKNIGFAIALGMLIAFVLVNLFMCIRYRDLGLISMLTSIINAVLYLFFMQALPNSFFVLTLSGIFGIVIGYMMTVLCHVVIFEKIRKEYSLGRKIPLSFKLGFKDSLFNIVDISSMGAIASVVLYLIGTTGLKSFAVTLLIGSVLSIVSSLLLTRLFTTWYLPLNNTNASHLALKKEAKNDEE